MLDKTIAVNGATWPVALSLHIPVWKEWTYTSDGDTSVSSFPGFPMMKAAGNLSSSGDVC